jgi:hypothetical protein
MAGKASEYLFRCFCQTPPHASLMPLRPSDIWLAVVLSTDVLERYVGGLNTGDDLQYPGPRFHFFF